MSEGSGEGGNKNNVIRGLFQRRMEQIGREGAGGRQKQRTDTISQLPLPEANLKLLAQRNAQQILEEFKKLQVTKMDPLLKSDAAQCSGLSLRKILIKHKGPVYKNDIFLFALAWEYNRRVESGGDI